MSHIIESAEYINIESSKNVLMARNLRVLSGSKKRNIKYRKLVKDCRPILKGDMEKKRVESFIFDLELKNLSLVI